MVIILLAWLFPLAALAAAAVGAFRAVAHFRGRRHRREVVRPVEASVVNILRSRAGVHATIPPELVGASRPGPTGSITLPLSWSGADGDRERLAGAVRERLRTPEAAVSFDMAGATPSMGIYIPKTAPSLVTWTDALERWNSTSPYLGESASGSVYWELGEDSPHIGVPGRSGSGKSEIMAWIVAQFMRGGAGVIVLDPKGTSHRWLLDLDLNGDAAVLYCGQRAMQYDTVMWLDSVMDDRIGQNRAATEDIDFPRIVVLLEERNSLQDRLRDAWTERREPGQPQMSPAIRALDRLSSMGRTLNINIVLGAQATAQADIGKKANYGAWLLSGGMTDNHWKNVGGKRPAISNRPGRFGYVVGGSVQVVQTAYPDLKGNRHAVVAWATGGAERFPVKLMMNQEGGVPFPSSGGGSSQEATPVGDTLREFALVYGVAVTDLRQWKKRFEGRGFPEPIDPEASTHRYWPAELKAYVLSRGVDIGA